MKDGPPSWLVRPRLEAETHDWMRRASASTPKAPTPVFAAVAAPVVEATPSPSEAAPPVAEPEVPAPASVERPSVDEHEALRAELVEAVAQAEAARAEVAAVEARLRTAEADHAARLRRLEEETVRLAFAVARRVVARELDTDPTIVTQWVREGLALFEGEPVVVLADPTTASVLSGEVSREEGVVLEIDPSLSRAECVLRTEEAAVSVGLDARFDALAGHLDVDLESAANRREAA